MVVPCPICGKLTAIYWPQFWVYRRGETYYCSENCLIVDRTRDVRLMNQVARERLIRKGVEDMGHHKLTLEQKKKAVEIESQGGNQLEYLRKCGAKNPSAAWFYIKKTLEVKETEKKAEPAEKPQLAEVVDKVPEIEGKQPKPRAGGVETKAMSREEHAEAHKRAGDWPPMFKGFYISEEIKVTGIETDFGKFSVDEDGSIRADVRTGTSVTTIVLKKEQWLQLMNGIETAMKIFAGGK